jgi:hypothetical protein
MVQYEVEHPEFESAVDEILDLMRDLVIDVVNDIKRMSLEDIASGNKLDEDYLVSDQAWLRMTKQIRDCISDNISHSIEIDPSDGI